MKLRLSARLIEKKHKSENNDNEIVPKKAKKKEEIKIANDILMKLLEWIPLGNLPNVNLANRRLWLYCDENLENRKHPIITLRLNANPDRMEVTRMVDGTVKNFKVPFTRVQPPKNFTLCALRVQQSVGRNATNFLRISKRLFEGALLSFWNRPGVNNDILDKFSGTFDRCAEMEDLLMGNDFTHEFFAKPPVLNCKSILLLSQSPDFDMDSVFDWLHTPLKFDPKAKRQINLGLYGEQSLLLPRIKEKFSRGDSKTRFIIRFLRDSFPESDNFRMELASGELLFTRKDDDYCDVVRCGKDEEDATIFESYGRAGEEFPYIFIYKNPILSILNGQ